VIEYLQEPEQNDIDITRYDNAIRLREEFDLLLGWVRDLKDVKANESPAESIEEDLSVHPVLQESEIPTRPKEDSIFDDERQKYLVWPGEPLIDETAAPKTSQNAESSAPQGTYPVWRGEEMPRPRRQDDRPAADNVRQIYPVWPG